MAKTNKSSKPIRNTKVSVDKPTAGTAESIQKILGKKLRIKCKNVRQKEFTKLILDKEIIVAAGPPGTGKSYLSIGKAIELLQNKTNNYERLLIVKPAVEAEEQLGFLPGDLKEKLEPHLASSIDIVDKLVGKANRVKLEEAEIIMVQPLGFIRGKTIDNSIVVIEESQNISPALLKTLLTRIGENSKYIISGDLNQSDKFRRFTQTGLYDIFQRLRTVPEIGFFQFEPEDIVRNPLITKILEHYDEQSAYHDAPLIDGGGEGFEDLTKDDDDDIIKYTKDESEIKNLDEATEGMPFLKKIAFKAKWNLYFYLGLITIKEK
jgi:phosphate starvation-inducible protein PhoH and related proteins